MRRRRIGTQSVTGREEDEEDEEAEQTLDEEDEEAEQRSRRYSRARPRFGLGENGLSTEMDFQMFPPMYSTDFSMPWS